MVLAMNRLVVLGRETLILFAVAREGGFNGSVVVHPPSGGVRVGTGRSKAEYLQWLQSEDVGAKVYESLGGLQGLLSALPFTSRLPQLDSPTLVVKSALCGLLQGLLSQFECDNVAMEMAGSPPLCRLLGRGLTSVLARRKNHYCCIDGYVTCLEVSFKSLCGCDCIVGRCLFSNLTLYLVNMSFFALHITFGATWH